MMLVRVSAPGNQGSPTQLEEAGPSRDPEWAEEEEQSGCQEKGQEEEVNLNQVVGGAAE